MCVAINLVLSRRTCPAPAQCTCFWCKGIQDRFNHATRLLYFYIYMCVLHAYVSSVLYVCLSVYTYVGGFQLST